MSRPEHADDGRGAWGWALGVVAAATVVRLVLAAAVPLFPDEAYYWEWSRHLAAGYFDHPPGIALLIAGGTALLGPTRLGVRLGPVLLGAVAAVAVAATARRVAGDRAALVAALIAVLAPLAAVGFVLATPDAPLLGFEAVTLYAVVRALEEPAGSRRDTAWWGLGAVALGFAFVSKYTGILVPVGVLAALLSRRDLRARLAGPGPWLAVPVASLVLLPVLVWNAHHDWISFAFQVQHGLGGSGWDTGAVMGRELEMIGGQAGLVSPILFVLGAVAVLRGLRADAPAAVRVLAVTGAVAFAFFLYSAVSRRVEANWPAVAAPPIIVVLATARWQRSGQRWLRAGLGLAAALSLVVCVQAVVPILPLHGRRDPIARAAGWETVARAADSVATAVAAERPGARAWIAGTRYQVAAELAFHGSGQPRTLLVGSRRPSQYDLWPDLPRVARPGDALVLVVADEEPPPAIVERLRPCFASAAPAAGVEQRRGGYPVAHRRIWVFRGWRGECGAAHAGPGPASPSRNG